MGLGWKATKAFETTNGQKERIGRLPALKNVRETPLYSLDETVVQRFILPGPCGV